MAEFYGYLSGNRGTATRCGSKNSGIRATIKSWRNTINCYLHYDEKDNDKLDIKTENHDGKDNLKVFINGVEYKRKIK